MPSSCRRAGAERYTRPQAGVAQLAEQLSCKQQVVGSNPTASSSKAQADSTFPIPRGTACPDWATSDYHRWPEDSRRQQSQMFNPIPENHGANLLGVPKSADPEQGGERRVLDHVIDRLEPPSARRHSATSILSMALEQLRERASVASLSGLHKCGVGGVGRSARLHATDSRISGHPGYPTPGRVIR